MRRHDFRVQKKNTEKREEKAILKESRGLPGRSLYFPLAWKWTETLPGHVRLMIFRSGQIFIYYSAGKIASGLDIR
ncbi:hypothetical protein DMI80_06030 [Akkermansia muciniphila]|nr:hypothetical protein DMI78_06025 [Akkermansia muciniphila]QHV70396.1 hypothetical protein DMI80_06030 [Akkermansia muciniphila]QHV72851.1 hypothetical protein DMI81_06030 [Akkermansia muciniphila]